MISPPITGNYAGGHQIGKACQVPISSNNSCLFSSLNYLLHRNSVPIKDLRALASRMIDADPETFNDVTLDRPRMVYIEWIRQEESWGGYIELIVLAKSYGIRITVIDIWSGRKDEYGDPSVNRRVFLLYDGVHYDALAAEDRCCSPFAENSLSTKVFSRNAPNPESYLTIFDSDDTTTLEKMVSIVEELRIRRKACYTSQNLVECCVCNMQFSSQDAVKSHALKTGHTRMKERRNA